MVPVLTGAYQTADPMGTFNNSSANGTWSLYFADMGSGGGSPVLDTWSLEIDAVPEPVNGSIDPFPCALGNGHDLALAHAAWD